MPVNRRGDRKISDFLDLSPIPQGGFLTYVVNGVNYKISLEEFQSTLGVTGSLNQVGSPIATPVLEKAGNANNIRNLENGRGAKASISPQNGIKLEHNFKFDQSGAPLMANPDLLEPVFRSLVAGQGINIAPQGDEIQISASDVVVGSQVVLVNELDDLPEPVAGVYTLADDTVYLVSSSLDFGSARIEMGDNTTIRGQSILTVILTSSTSDTFINRSGGGGCAVSNVSIRCPNAECFGYAGAGGGADIFILRSFVILDCDRIATINSPILWSGAGFVVLNATTRGFVISGTGSTLNVDSCVFNNFNGTLFDLTTSVYTFVDAENLNIVSNNPASVIVDGLPNSGNIAVGGQGTLRASSIAGTFTDNGNIINTDIRWDFSNVNVLPDSVNECYIAMPSNGTATTFAAANIPTKLLGTFTPVKQSRFTADAAGTMTYIGVQPISVTIAFTTTFIKGGSGTQNFILYVYKNGSPDPNVRAQFASDNSRDPNISLTGVIDLVTNDVLELFIENEDNTNSITAFSLNWVVEAAG